MQRGVSLVETLVALVVLSIGLLGIAGLLVEGLRSSRSALLRTVAVQLAADLAECIRANPGARMAYATSHYPAAPAPQDCAPRAASPGRNCSEAQLAEDDLARWQREVRRTLPPPADPATAAVAGFEAGMHAGLPDRYAIRIAWREPGVRGAADFRYETTLVLLPALSQP